MLTLEIFKSPKELEKYLYLMESNRANTIIYASIQQVLERLADKGQEWYAITYRGDRRNLEGYLSAVRVDNWKDYYLHINMPESYSVDDMTDVAADVCKVNNSPQVEPVIKCTCDAGLEGNNIEVTVIVPKFDLTWHFGKMWDDNSR